MIYRPYAMMQNRSAAAERIRQRPELKRQLNNLVTRLVSVTAEVVRPLYDQKTGLWQFFFPYIFPGVDDHILKSAEELLSSRKIKLKHFPEESLRQKNIMFCLTEDDIELFFVMNKLMEE